MTTTTPRKKPQDRLPAKSDQFASEAEPAPEGAELLKPATALPSWDRLDLVALLQETFDLLGIDLEEGDSEVELKQDADTMRAIAKMQRGLVPVAIDEKAFIEFASTPEAIEKVTNLAMWYLGALGESMGSAS